MHKSFQTQCYEDLRTSSPFNRKYTIQTQSLVPYEKKWKKKENILEMIWSEKAKTELYTDTAYL